MASSPASVPAPVRRILLVEDEPDIRDSLKDLLEGALERVEVVLAADAEEGLALLERHLPHLILSDYKMPGRSGIEFLAEARRLAPTTPRVLMTAFPDLEVALRAINETRIHSFLAKPLDASDVVRRVESILRQEEGRRESEATLARAIARRTVPAPG